MTEKTRSETGHAKVMTYVGTFAVLVFLLAGACTPIAGFSEKELSICGFKFHDLNENGVLDKNEPGLENWTFTLTNNGEKEIIDYATTDEYGYFCFNDIPAGHYSIDEVLQEGWYNTTSTHQSIIIEESSEMLYFGNAQEKENYNDNETGDDNGDGGEEEPPIEEPSSPPTKKKSSEPIHINPMPIAKGDGPYQAQLGESITFNGSASKDDGSIIEWLWDFGDGTTASGEIVTHTYTQAITYAVSLTVTDNYYKKGYPYKTVASIIQPNRSPEKPDILGPSEGTMNTGYSFVTIAHDPDGDDLRYIFDWGDGETTSIPFAPTDYHVAGAHSWKEEGTYTITVSTSDGELSASAEKMIHIEAQSPAVDYAIVVGLAVLGAILFGLFIALMKRDHNK
jgi:hypothetical protein